MREPDSIIIDRVGFKFFFPEEPLQLGKTLEMNDRRVQVMGIANSSAAFQNLPVFYTRYSQAITYVGRDGPVFAHRRLPEQLHDGVTGLGVERGRGLVADQQPWFMNQSPGQRHASS